MAIKSKELANLLGVSTATMSLVLNHKQGISDELRSSLLSRIREMGYGYMIKETPEAGLVCREWLGYLNLNLTMLISRLEALKEEWRIKSDDEVRIVFWFDN